MAEPTETEAFAPSVSNPLFTPDGVEIASPDKAGPMEAQHGVPALDWRGLEDHDAPEDDAAEALERAAARVDADGRPIRTTEQLKAEEAAFRAEANAFRQRQIGR